MFYAPHTLYVKRSIIERDEYNRPLKATNSWQYVCECRCDDDSSVMFQSEDGRYYRSKYHIVCPDGIDVKEEEEIKAFKGKTLRGEGKVISKKTLNKLKYSELWV